MNGPLDVAHQINDLVMGDPNADVLRGGHFEDQVYHTAFLTVLMRKEPLETFITYLGQAHRMFSRFLNLRNFLCFVFLLGRSFLLRSKMPI